jgi:type VI secretion system secreted protein VgrG
MPSPKSGKAGSAVDPVESKAAEEADKADPGEVEQVKAAQRQTQTGKYGSVQTKPHKPVPAKKGWIEIEMVDEQGDAVPSEAYRITLPDGSVAEGTLDDKGFAKLTGIDSGTCQIGFPNLDGEAWEKI